MLQEGEPCPNCGGTLKRISLREAKCESCGGVVEVRYHSAFVEKPAPMPEVETQPVNETPTSNGENKQLPVTSKQTIVTNYKSVLLAFILSFFLPGLGYAYAGKGGVGVAMFIFAIIFLGLTAVLPFFLIGYIIIWLAGMYLGCKLASENNRLWEEYNS